MQVDSRARLVFLLTSQALSIFLEAAYHSYKNTESLRSQQKHKTGPRDNLHRLSRGFLEVRSTNLLEFLAIFSGSTNSILCDIFANVSEKYRKMCFSIGKIK